MIKAIIASLLLIISLPSTAQQTFIENTPLGSGTPILGNTTDVFSEGYAVDPDNNLFFAPQFMSYFPTAATLWPRVVEVECEKVSGAMVCNGYHWQPKYGRGEYLFFSPVMKKEPKVVVAPAPPPIIKYIEVPHKKKPQ